VICHSLLGVLTTTSTNAALFFLKNLLAALASSVFSRTASLWQLSNEMKQKEFVIAAKKEEEEETRARGNEHTRAQDSLRNLETRDE